MVAFKNYEGMTKNVIVSVLISLVCSVAVVGGYHLVVKEKTGYVRTGFVIAQYKGMIEANKVFEKERLQVQTNIDTLQKRYDYLLGLEKSVAGKRQKEVSYKLGVAESDYERYASTAMKQLEQRRVELTSSVIKEINSTIESYGRKNGFKIVFGATDDGSLLYGEPDGDISNVILEILNANYKGVEN